MDIVGLATIVAYLTELVLSGSGIANNYTANALHIKSNKVKKLINEKLNKNQSLKEQLITAYSNNNMKLVNSLAASNGISPAHAHGLMQQAEALNKYKSDLDKIGNQDAYLNTELSKIDSAISTAGTGFMGSGYKKAKNKVKDIEKEVNELSSINSSILEGGKTYNAK